MRAYSYLRISTPEQRHGDGVRRQLETTRAYCHEKGLELDEAPMADLGLSGYHGDHLTRGALGGFQRGIESGRIPSPCALILENLDRLSRQQIDEAVFLLLGLVRLGVEIHTTMDRQIYRTGEMDMTRMLISIITLARGHEESATKARRLKAVWEKKRSQANETIMTSACPGWLVPRQDRSGFDQVPERVALVQRIFKLTSEGLSKARIAAMLNAEGVAVWGKGKRAGTRWHSSYLQKILTSQSVLGHFQPMRKTAGGKVAEGEMLKDYYPAVISPQLFKRAASSRASRLRHRVTYPNPDAPRNLLSGRTWLNGTKTYWTNKGRKQTSAGSRGTKKKAEGYWVYYTALDPATGMVTARIRRETVEDLVLGRLVQIEPNDLRLAPPMDVQGARLSGARARVKEGEARIERLMEAIASGVGSPSLAARIVEEEAALESTREVLKEAEEETNNQKAVKERLPRNLDAIRKLALEKNDPATREALTRHLAEVIERVDLATAPESLPEWAAAGAAWLADAMRTEPGRGHWVAITLRSGARIAGTMLETDCGAQVLAVEADAYRPGTEMRINFGPGGTTLAGA